MADQNTTYDRLKKLFSRKVMIRRIGRDKLKTTDLSRSQSEITTNAITDRYKRMHMGRTFTGMYPGEAARNDKLNYYQDYEVMDNDPIISSALDILSDESTLKSPDGKMLKISSDNDRIKEVLENLFSDILNIDHNLWSWVRNLCKYGDYYLFLDIDEKYGVKNVVPFSPYVLARDEGYDEKNPYAYRFIIDDASTNSWTSSANSNSRIFESYQIAHFRLLSDTNFLPYGKSVIENARKIFKQLSMMEDAMLLVRIMRAPERRVFKIDVGNIPPEQVDAFIEEVKSTMQKTPYIDPVTGDYNLKYNLMNMLEDFYLPVRGSSSGTSIDTIPGLASTTQIEDVTYLKGKLMSALKIPPSFLGQDTDLGGRATLAALDIRFARTIERIQKVMSSELRKIAIIHLYVQGFKGTDLSNFEISLANPSIVYERQKVEFMTEQMTLVEAMVSNKIFSNRFIYETVFGLSETEWREIQEELVEDQKFSWRLDQIVANGKDPEFNDGMDEEGGDEDIEPEDEDGGDEPTPKGPKQPGSKINAGYDEDGRQEMNRVTKPEPNPLGPEFYGKGALEPENKIITGALTKLLSGRPNKNTNTKTKITEDVRLIQFLDESKLKEFK